MVHFFNYNSILSSIKFNSNNDRDNLVLSVIPMCIKIAKRYANTQEQAEDILSAILCELLVKTENFNEDKAKYITFAYYVACSTAYHNSLNCGVVVNPKAHKAFATITKAMQRYYVEFGTYPSEEELIQLLDGKVKAENITELLNPTFFSMDTALTTEDGEFSTFADCGEVAEKTQIKPAETLENADLNKDIKMRLARLNDKEKAVICLAFGFNKSQIEYDFKTIGESLNISDEGARKIYKRALAKMR